MSRVTTIRGPLLRLVVAMGGVVEAARVLGVDRRTLRRWGTGETWPGEEDRKRVNRVAREWGCRGPFGWRRNHG